MNAIYAMIGWSLAAFALVEHRQSQAELCLVIAMGLVWHLFRPLAHIERWMTPLAGVALIGLRYLRGQSEAHSIAAIALGIIVAHEVWRRASLRPRALEFRNSRVQRLLILFFRDVLTTWAAGLLTYVAVSLCQNVLSGKNDPELAALSVPLGAWAARSARSGALHWHIDGSPG